MQKEDKVLVVEDDPAITRVIEERFACDCASDGWDAISKLETEDYAAIVIDADVSCHSGYGVLTYLREEIGENLGHVIMISASADHDDVRRRVGETLTIVDKGSAVDELTKILA
jgi:DNA-binding response OmpR family regulator